MLFSKFFLLDPDTGGKMIADPCRFGSTGLNKTVIYGTGRKYKYDLYGYVSVQLVFLPDDAQPRVDDLLCPHCLQAPTPTNVVFTTATIAGSRRGTDRQSNLRSCILVLMCVLQSFNKKPSLLSYRYIESFEF